MRLLAHATYCVAALKVSFFMQQEIVSYCIKALEERQGSIMKEWYQISTEDVMKSMETTENGLPEEEAKERLKEYGENVLVEGKRRTVAQIFLGQFADLLVAILIVAALISAFSGNMESTLVILVVIILNAVLGTVQYVKAEKSLESLKNLSSPNAKVLRFGTKMEIPAREVVPGDILLLEAGDLVAADGRILHNYSLQVNESSLTGESTNIDKSEGAVGEETALADRVNMVYSGSLVTYGRANVIVTGTGMDTEIGKIAGLLNTAKEKKTPLQVSLDDFGKKLAVIIMVICAVVFGLSLYRRMEILDALMFAVALAVAAIPEALSSIVTIVQAMGTQKMARENAIIKDLKAVESLGCVSVICSDKTGTLTQNKMTVKQIYMNHEVFAPERLDVKQQLHRYLMYDAILNNDSRTDDGKVIGDPTESALLEMVRKAGIDDDLFREEMSRLEELPFDSDRKLMSTEYKLHGVATLLTKGALDVLLERSCSIWDEAGVRSMTEADRNEIEQKNLEFSERGLRVLAFAFREMEKGETLTLEGERDYTFLGLVAMIDPPREESKAAVADAKRAGIRPVMITGDHKITATAIAKEIGIFGEGDIAMIGTELDAMTDKELDQLIEHIAVFARVSPENKIRIVEAWQRKGRIVSMTGDGVNDAPALKAADIGVAMGITGTEVSKDAASMILTDDNFATIIKAVANGRNVYKNIKNAILFLLSGNMAGIMAVLYTSIAALPVPFAPVHLLFINLLTDSLPALAIGMEPTENDMLAEKPRDPKAGILSGRFMALLLVQGGLIAACTMFSFYAGLSVSVTAASTMAFATLTLARLFHGFNCRSRHSVFKIGFARNWYSLGAFVLGAVLLGAVLFVPPLQRLFAVEPLSGEALGLVFLMAVLPTMCIQLFKIVMDGRQ